MLLITALLTLAQAGTVERVQVHGKSLEGNLIGDAPDRGVHVYLPPSYAKSKGRRYPVVYFLHGFTDSDAKWFGTAGKHWIHLPQTLDKALANAAVKETIVVMPNADNAFFGSMYASSVTIGDWETFVARDLVAYVDQHYRTLPAAESRGLAGHSMGGYGTLRIGMRHPDVFSALYALSPCCMSPNLAAGERWTRLSAVKSLEDLAKADFGTKATFASAAAWSANPAKPPFYVDLPWKDGQFDAAIGAKWQANAPLVEVDQHLGVLRGMRGLALDAGDKDGFITGSTRSLHELLDQHKVPHFSEIYQGDHLSGIAVRIETKVMPFFSERLVTILPGKAKSR